jgi:hypothetical protein
MITVDDNAAQFPWNAVVLIATRLNLVDEDIPCFRRRLYSTDPVQTFGCSPANWHPVQDSLEMRGADLAQEPTIQKYSLVVQAMVKDTDEERGIAVHSQMSKIARSILLTDIPLRDSLRALSADLYGVRERTLRWSIQSQRYLSEELKGQFTYLSTIEVQLETENSRAPSQ